MKTRSKRIAWTPKHNTRTIIHNSGYTIVQNKEKILYRCDKCRLIFKTIPGVKSHLRSCDTDNPVKIKDKNDSTTREVSNNMGNISKEEGSSSNTEILDKTVDLISPECSSEINSDAQDLNSETHVKIEVTNDTMDVFININSEGNSSEQDTKNEELIKEECSKIEEKYSYKEKEETDIVYACGYCGKTFVKLGFYQSHLAIIHSESTNKLYTCDLCPKIFTTKGRLEHHTKRHQKKKCYQCDICSKRYYKYGQIIRHLATHEPNNPFQCKTCSKVLTTKKFLNAHMRMHTGEKLYQCTVCPKMFGFKHHLVKHMLKHDIAKPYKCKICFKSYDNCETYDRHVGTHNYRTDPVYICHECPSRFDDYSSLKLHRKQHDIQLHYCPTCHKKYIKKENLVEHMKSHM